MVNMTNLLTDTTSLVINKAKLVPLLKFISNIDVGSGGAAPRILAEQVVPNGKTVTHVRVKQCDRNNGYFE